MLYELQEGGCQFGPDDLSLEEWKGLARLKGALKRQELQGIEQADQETGQQ